MSRRNLYEMTRRNGPEEPGRTPARTPTETVSRGRDLSKMNRRDGDAPINGRGGVDAHSPAVKGNPSVGERIVSALKGTGANRVAGHLGTAENLLGLGRELDIRADTKNRADAEMYERNAKRYKWMLDHNQTPDGQYLSPQQRDQFYKMMKQAEKNAGISRDVLKPENRQLTDPINKVDAAGDRMQEIAEQNHARGKQGLGTIGSLAYDVGTGAVDVLADMGENILLPGLGTAGRFSRTYGNTAEAAQDAGATVGQQALTGGLTAGVGEGINRLFGGNPILEKATGRAGALDDILFPNLGKTLPGRMVKSGIGEAIEEGVENPIDYAIRRGVYDHEGREKFSWQDMGRDALVGGLIGGLTGISGGKDANPTARATETAQDGVKPATPNVDAPKAENAPGASEGAGVDVAENATTAQVAPGPDRNVGTAKAERPFYFAEMIDKGPRAARAVANKFVEENVNSSSGSAGDYRWEIDRHAWGPLYEVKIWNTATGETIEYTGNTDNHAPMDAVRGSIASDIETNIEKHSTPVGREASGMLVKQATDSITPESRIGIILKDSMRNGFTKDSGEAFKAITKVNQWLEMGSVDSIRRAATMNISDIEREIYNYVLANDPAVYMGDIQNFLGAVDEVNSMDYGDFLDRYLALTGGKRITERPEPAATVSKNATVAEESSDVGQNPSMGAADMGFDPFTEAQFKYGTQKEGENPVRSDDVPVSTDGEDRVSHSVVTAKGAEVTPDEFVPLIERETMDGRFSFIPITNDESVQSAEKTIMDKGWQQARADWTADVRAGKAGDQITAIGALLYNNAVNAGDFAAAMDIFTDYQYAVRNSARGLQAARILKTLNPEARLYMIRKSIQNIVDELGVDIKLTDELEQAYLNAKTDQEINDAVEAIEDYVAERMPSTALDKWTALRYVNMLGNFKTQVRNVAGNVGMRTVSSVNNLVAAFLEKLAGNKAEKTRSAVVGKPLMDAAKADFDTVRAEAMGEGKYDPKNLTPDTFSKAVNDKKRIFRSDLMEGYRKATNWAMNNKYFGDEAFTRSSYARALAGYLKANHITAEQMNDPNWRNSHARFLDKARDFAVKRAQQDTFRDTNTLSKWVSKIGRRADTPKAVKIMAEGVMPFRKTPANVLVRAEEYSPLGLANTIMNAVNVKRGKATTNDVIESLSKTLTGTGIFLAGMMLKNAGVLRGGEEEDKKLAEADDLTGHQPYSVELPDGTSFTLDWLTPAAMPLFMGAQFEQMREEGGFQLKDLEGSLTSLAEPMIKMSMMQGVEDVMSDIKRQDSPNIFQMASSLALGYLTQGMTNSLVGQLTRSAKEESMMTYTDKDSPMPTWLQREFGAASRKMPGAEYNQIPFIDAWGRTEKTGDFGDRLMNNLLNPAFTSTIKETDVDRELRRIYDRTGESQFPTRAAKTIKIDGKEKNLSGEEYVKYAKGLGQKRFTMLENAIGKEWYKSMSDSEKAKYIQKVYGYAKATEEAKLGKPMTDKWMANVQHAQADLGVSPEEFIAMTDKYGAANFSGATYEKLKTAHSIGMDPEEYFRFKQESKDLLQGKGRNGKERSDNNTDKDEARLWARQNGYADKTDILMKFINSSW